MRRFLSITKALSDPNRLRILCSLRGGELCVCQIIEMLRLAPSTVSKHLSILAMAGLVDSRKEARWMYYRLPDQASPAVRDCLEWVFQHLASEAAIREDTRKVKLIVRLPPEELCRIQAAGQECCAPPGKAPRAK